MTAGSDAAPPRISGAVVVIAGTDGSGKTAVAERLLRDELAAPVLHLHHRPAVLPGRTEHTGGPVTEPHQHEPYPLPLSVLKVLYLWCDYMLGWLLRVRPHVARGGSVLLERGWWDLAVDPRRYRLAPLPRLIRFTAALLPRPDATVVLRAPTDVLLRRKQELPAAELSRQQAAWAAAPRGVMRPVYIDAAQPLDTVMSDVAAALHDAVRPRR